MTTIEMYEKKKSIPWRYDYGKHKNFAEVLEPALSLFFSLPPLLSALSTALVGGLAARVCSLVFHSFSLFCTAPAAGVFLRS